MTTLLRPILALGLLVASTHAHAAEGFFDTLFGGSSRSAPPNPFASNYPSAPPTPDEVRAEHQRRPVRTERERERGRGPLPPGRIPEE
ncbi:hypothetical protein QO001_003947 [Methylobacterium brachiatum]|uniref:Uncharacterized protein n=1 Tax=Methylobacterium brachiatum TaxID=269660 RepID=A0AAJ1WVV5_9HYPH|nr:hypothetical protein [Methylobacterium brachiatum]MCB4803754.1 hypothetical protein [Methylobacterium brachiatum]MDQ0545009.1 hypothetical protein [Methylobacterium brachiatum]